MIKVVADANIILAGMLDSREDSLSRKLLSVFAYASAKQTFNELICSDNERYELKYKLETIIGWMESEMSTNLPDNLVLVGSNLLLDEVINNSDTVSSNLHMVNQYTEYVLRDMVRKLFYGGIVPDEQLSMTPGVTQDAADDYLISMAFYAGADIVLSRDKHVRHSQDKEIVKDYLSPEGFNTKAMHPKIFIEKILKKDGRDFDGISTKLLHYYFKINHNILPPN